VAENDPFGIARFTMLLPHGLIIGSEIKYLRHFARQDSARMQWRSISQSIYRSELTLIEGLKRLPQGAGSYHGAIFTCRLSDCPLSPVTSCPMIVITPSSVCSLKEQSRGRTDVGVCPCHLAEESIRGFSCWQDGDLVLRWKQAPWGIQIIGVRSSSDFCAKIGVPIFITKTLANGLPPGLTRQSGRRRHGARQPCPLP